MIDPGTGLAILGSALGGAKIIEKILGPTADYVGNNLKDWTEKKINNTSNVFKNAEKKLGSKIEKEGQIPPKVLKGILEEAPWCEEELQVEYFGGVLASSRSEVSRDDRGAYFISLISRLSTYQLRSHYLIYQSIKNHFNGRDMNIGDNLDRYNMEIFISYDIYSLALDFTPVEIKNFYSLMEHSVWGLNKENLIANTLTYGPVDYIKKRYAKANTGGIFVQPSSLGIELFMWAYGYGELHTNSFFKKTIIFPNDQNILIGETEKLR